MQFILIVKKTINVAGGTAHYIGTEIEDENGSFNDNYKTTDGYWLIHEGKYHHVYSRHIAIIPPVIDEEADRIESEALAEAERDDEFCPHEVGSNE